MGLFALRFRSLYPSCPPQALFTNSSADDRGEPLEEEEEEDHTYELLLTAQTKVPPPSQEALSSKGKSEFNPKQVFICFLCSACTFPLLAARITAEWLKRRGHFPVVKTPL